MKGFSFCNVYRINYIGIFKGERKIEDSPVVIPAWLLHLRATPSPGSPRGKGHRQWFSTLVTHYFIWGTLEDVTAWLLPRPLK